jgi:hypothetical protein
MTLKRSRCREIDRVIAYSLSDVADEFARQLGRYWIGHKRKLQKRGARIPAQDVKGLLLKAFTSVLLTPRYCQKKASKQRDALLFVLAAASAPPHLALSGIPSEIRRAQRRRRNR